MYKVNDLIIYGDIGVCEITDITKLKGMKGSDDNKKYYVLSPVFQAGTIYTPVDDPKVFMRPVITREKAEEIINGIPQIVAEPYYNKSIQQLTEHYKNVLDMHNCADLVELTMSIYAKKVLVERQKKKFSSIDERFMKRAEALLFDELSIALDIPRDKVQEYISERVEELKEKA